MDIAVTGLNGGSRGLLRLGGVVLRCALGRSGIVTCKREGDGGTPRGLVRPLAVYYRADRVRRPATRLPVRAIRPDDGWCDAPADPNYNRPVRHPYRASAEHMWRQDGLYDLVLVLDCNVRPRKRGGGSAIFLHVAHPAKKPTEGCIALSRPHVQRLLGVLSRGSRLWIDGPARAMRPRR